jgi:hypothetical protein
LIYPLLPIHAISAFDLALQLGDPPARLIEAADFLLRLLWQQKSGAPKGGSRRSTAPACGGKMDEKTNSRSTDG